MPIVVENQPRPLCRICGIRPVAKTGKPYKGRIYLSHRCSECRGKRSDDDCFWSKVDRSGDCWLWLGSKDRAGYGRFRSREAHRWVFSKMVTQIPENAYVCHKCDNPLCVNPEHLFLGDHAANMADMVKKGRQRRHEDHPRAKLTKAAVIEAREMVLTGISQASLARRYGMSTSAMNAAILGRTWKGL